MRVLIVLCALAALAAAAYTPVASLASLQGKTYQGTCYQSFGVSSSNPTCTPGNYPVASPYWSGFATGVNSVSWVVTQNTSSIQGTSYCVVGEHNDNAPVTVTANAMGSGYYNYSNNCVYLASDGTNLIEIGLYTVTDYAASPICPNASVIAGLNNPASLFCDAAGVANYYCTMTQVTGSTFTPVTNVATQLGNKAFRGTCYQQYAEQTTGPAQCIYDGASGPNQVLMTKYGSYYTTAGTSVTWKSSSNTSDFYGSDYFWDTDIETQAISAGTTAFGSGYWKFTGASDTPCVYLGMVGTQLVEIGLYNDDSPSSTCPSFLDVANAGNIMSGLSCDHNNNNWNYYCVMDQATSPFTPATQAQLQGKAFRGTCYEAFAFEDSGATPACTPNNAVFSNPYTTFYNADASMVTWDVIDNTMTLGGTTFSYPGGEVPQTVMSRGSGYYNYSSGCVYLGYNTATNQLIEIGLYNYNEFAQDPNSCPDTLDVDSAGLIMSGALYCADNAINAWNYYCVMDLVSTPYSAVTAPATQLAGKAFVGACYEAAAYKNPDNTNGACTPSGKVFQNPYTTYYNADASMVTWDILPNSTNFGGSTNYYYAQYQETDPLTARTPANSGYYNYGGACVYLGMMNNQLVEIGVYNQSTFLQTPNLCPNTLDVASVSQIMNGGLYCDQNNRWNYYCVMNQVSSGWTPVTSLTAVAGKSYSGKCYQSFGLTSTGSPTCIPNNQVLIDGYTSDFNADASMVNWVAADNQTTIGGVVYEYPQDMQSQTVTTHGSVAGFYNYASGCVFLGMMNGMLIEIGIYNSTSFTSLNGVCPSALDIAQAMNYNSGGTYCMNGMANYYCIMDDVTPTGTTAAATTAAPSTTASGAVAVTPLFAVVLAVLAVLLL